MVEFVIKINILEFVLNNYDLIKEQKINLVIIKAKTVSQFSILCRSN